ncbi:MAG: hypothetical protein PHX54_03695 [Lentimicrobiaceae bacterium]|jgi:hypothetical protein|nr:hypothetical protein [Brumimicrobium sp.]MDD3742708.1 hypothetical protein [Lentimicrobiaceae bacterium]
MSKEINNKINDALYDFYLEADKDIIKDSLKSDIQNLDEYNKKKKQIIFLAQAKAKQKHNEYLLALANKFQEAVLQNIEKPVAILKQLIQGNASLALYRNLDKLSKEDIIEIIKDKNLVELLEQLENNDKSH